MEIFYDASKEWVRFFSHDFVVTNHKTFLKNFGGPSKSTDEKGKKKKKESQLQNFFQYTQTRKTYNYLGKVSYGSSNRPNYEI